MYGLCGNCMVTTQLGNWEMFVILIRVSPGLEMVGNSTILHVWLGKMFCGWEKCTSVRNQGQKKKFDQH